MAERCVCGNLLREMPIEVRLSPCRCGDARGPGPSHLELENLIPDGVTRESFEERRRVGLPIVTPMERAMFRHKSWH